MSRKCFSQWEVHVSDLGFRISPTSYNSTSLGSIDCVLYVEVVRKMSKLKKLRRTSDTFFIKKAHLDHSFTMLFKTEDINKNWGQVWVVFLTLTQYHMTLIFVIHSRYTEVWVLFLTSTQYHMILILVMCSRWFEGFPK